MHREPKCREIGVYLSTKRFQTMLPFCRSELSVPWHCVESFWKQKTIRNLWDSFPNIIWLSTYLLFLLAMEQYKWYESWDNDNDAQSFNWREWQPRPASITARSDSSGQKAVNRSKFCMRLTEIWRNSPGPEVVGYWYTIGTPTGIVKTALGLHFLVNWL